MNSANIGTSSGDPRAVKVVAKSIHKQLLVEGFGTQDVIALASELLALAAHDVRVHRNEQTQNFSVL